MQFGFEHVETRLALQFGQNFALVSVIGFLHCGHLFLNLEKRDFTPFSTPPTAALSALHFKLFLALLTISSSIPIFLLV
jgi:hypothetical protein